jgi:DNA-binding LacI/PurR family transcriptional regulator
MRKGPITIKDIAQKLNISVATVSKALRGFNDVSADTKKAVLDLAKKWDYHPNAVALSLVKSRTNNIGIIIPGFIIPFYASAISGIQEVLSNNGYNLLICQSNESYKDEVTNTQAFISSRIDGLIISMSRETKNFDHFRQIEKRGIPMVFINRACYDIETPRVLVDDYEGAFNATEHLINTGRRKIAHIAGPPNLSLSINRFNGYKDALKKHQIPFDKRLVIECDLTRESGYVIMDKFLKINPQPDAIFTVCDAAAYGAISRIHESTLKIPKDISIVGFTNEPVSAIIDPPLTTISQPTFEIGQVAARMLIDLIKNENPAPPYETKVLKTNLVIRDSG